MARSPYGPYVYVPLPFISQYVVRAVLTTEDHIFFRHDGFNRSALKESVERNLAAQEYVRGASTISMQLVKNLYLNRKKVMSRKIQEAFLVFLIESHLHVPKARLLEIYLNIIEFGPGIFGIHDAAIHYFGKRPNELTLPEAAWLVTLVPSPKRWHQLWEKNTRMPDKGWDRVRRYMQAMVSRGKIAQEEVDAAMEQRPEFRHPAMDAPAMQPVVAPMPLVPIFGDPVIPQPSQQRFEEEMRELLE
jgi:membrane peptidoglycan carboxypeptidase